MTFPLLSYEVINHVTCQKQDILMDTNKVQIKTYNGEAIAGTLYLETDGVLKSIKHNQDGTKKWQYLDPSGSNIVSRIIQLPIIPKKGTTQKFIDVDMKTLFMTIFPDRDVPYSIINMQKYMKKPPR
jgi:hypothetical protein